MLTQQQMTEMFELQDKLNIQTNGTDWTLGVTKEGRKIDWHRCIYMETAELIDSLNWKHWKDINKPDDMENVKIELVDIWHFIMSEIITMFQDSSNLVSYIEMAYNTYKKQLEKKTNLNLFEISEKMMQIALNKSVPLHEFFQTVEMIDNFDMQEVYKLYIGKNCLNQFRQDNGYKDGTYKKLWNGKEDNVYMQDFLTKKPNATYKELYNFLKELYRQS